MLEGPGRITLKRLKKTRAGWLNPHFQFDAATVEQFMRFTTAAEPYTHNHNRIPAQDTDLHRLWEDDIAIGATPKGREELKNSFIKFVVSTIQPLDRPESKGQKSNRRGRSHGQRCTKNKQKRRAEAAAAAEETGSEQPESGEEYEGEEGEQEEDVEMSEEGEGEEAEEGGWEDCSEEGGYGQEAEGEEYEQ